MVVDSKEKLLTARVFPHMVLIEASVSPPSPSSPSSPSSLTLSYPGLPAVTVELPAQPGQAQPGYAVFREEVAGCDLGDQVGAWLSEVILVNWSSFNSSSFLRASFSLLNFAFSFRSCSAFLLVSDSSL